MDKDSTDPDTTGTSPVPPLGRSDGALRELAAFLRAKRSRAGLGRERVAVEARISSNWYARIEQARAPGLTEPTLHAVCEALGLGTIERDHVKRLLASSRSGAERPPPGADPVTVGRLVGEMRGAPAYVIDRRWHIAAFNDAAPILFEGLDALEGRERNCLWQHYLNPRFRRALDAERDVLRYLTALFRRSTAGSAGTEWRADLISGLAARSPEFATIWEEQGLAEWGAVEKAFDHPGLGRLRFTNVSHEVSTMEGETFRIVSYIPVEGSGTRERIAAALAGDGAE